jgi:hypothetical protein
MTQYKSQSRNLVMGNTAIDSAQTSNWVNVDDAEQITVEVEFTRVAGTALTFTIEMYGGSLNPNVTAPATIELTPYGVASHNGSGTVSYYTRTFSWTTSTTGTYPFNIPINTRWVRVKNLTATSGGATDKAKVYIRTSNK